jgi:peptidoglycan/LPS O-acetylase OafA/YrhL
VLLMLTTVVAFSAATYRLIEAPGRAAARRWVVQLRIRRTSPAAAG